VTRFGEPFGKFIEDGGMLGVPKYNKILNGHRHPVQELTRRQANDQRYRNVIAHRTAEAAANSMAPQDPDETNVSPLHGKRGAR
jgi:hypothetical protein